MERVSTFSTLLLGFVLFFPFEARANPCHPPALTFTSVVHYEGYAKALLTFDFDTRHLRVRIEREDGTEWGVYELRSSMPRLLLTNLPQHELFAVYAGDGCGDMQPVGWFETWPGKDGDQSLRVSKALFHASELFVRQEEVALPLFLKNRNEIPLLDRLWFLQQYLYEGAPFPQDFGRNYPPDDFWDQMPELTRECHCALLTYASARPSIMQGGNIIPKTNQVSGSLGTNADFELKTAYAGAAKHVELLTKGCRAGGVDYVYRYNVTEEQNESIGSSSYGLLEYHLLCVNTQKIKADCPCSRCVLVNASYSTRLNADATVKTGCWSAGKDKWAFALAQDISTLVHVSAKNGFQILAADNVHVSKEVEKSLNEEFFMALVDVVANLAPSLDAFTIQALDLNALAQSLKNLIGESVSENEGKAGPEQYVGQRFRVYDREICFEANDPNRILLFSFGHVVSGGRRKWRAHAYVQGGFHLDGIVKANFEQEACCQDEQLGDWLAKNLIDDSSLDTYEMQARVVEDFALWPWNGWSPYDGLPGEYGRLSFSWGVCDSSGLTGPDKEQVEDWWQQLAVGREAADVYQAADADSEIRPSAPTSVQAVVPTCPCRLEVIDLQGRILYVLSDLPDYDPVRLRERLRAQGVFPAPGIYLFRLTGGRGMHTDRIFVGR